MRISREQVAENREYLLATALEQFRLHGFDGVGIADIMKAAGMTAGSFYGYFESKEQLVAEASAKAISGTSALMSSSLRDGKPDALARFVDRYLSPAHRDNLAHGCALAALGSEMSHQPETVKHEITKELRSLFQETEQGLAGATTSSRENSAIALVASLLGGLILSRAVDDPKLSRRILSVVSKAIKQSNTSAQAD